MSDTTDLRDEAIRELMWVAERMRSMYENGGHVEHWHMERIDKFLESVGVVPTDDGEYVAVAKLRAQQGGQYGQ